MDRPSDRTSIKDMGSRVEVKEWLYSFEGAGPLTERLVNLLLRNGFATVGDVNATTDAELLGLRNFGKGCLRLWREAFGPGACPACGHRPEP